MKAKGLETLNHILKYIFENVPNSVKKGSPFLPKAQ